MVAKIYFEYEKQESQPNENEVRCNIEVKNVTLLKDRYDHYAHTLTVTEVKILSKKIFELEDQLVILTKKEFEEGLPF